MSSSVFFKFRSEREPSRVTFDGTGISAFELKREIIKLNNLGDGHDFDLQIFNSDTNEEYDDDTTIIPRSTSVSAKRLPAVRAGRGTAARYVSGKAPVTAKNQTRMEKVKAKDTQPAPKPAAETFQTNSAFSEEENIAAMLNANAEQWDMQRKEMANATPVYRNASARGKPSSSNNPTNPPPPTYICYRCGEKGHYIQQCPTNDNPDFDGRPRVKRTTGIPRSFLRTVAKPEPFSKDGPHDEGAQSLSVMVNAEGEYVVAEPDNASWAQYQAKTKASEQAQQQAVSGSRALRDLGLECSIDKKLFVEPTKTPCCKKTFCNECITNALLEGDLTCPTCQTEGVILDDLTYDEETALKLKEYIEKRPAKQASSPMMESLQEKNFDSTKSHDQKQETTDKREKAEQTAMTQERKSLPTPIQSNDRSSESFSTVEANSITSGKAKKRAPELELENSHIPRAPAAMRLKNQQVQTTQSYSAPNSTHVYDPSQITYGQPAMGNLSNGMTNFGYPDNSGYLAMPFSMNSGMTMTPNFPMSNYGNGFGGFDYSQGNNMGGSPMYNGTMSNAGFNQASFVGMNMPQNASAGAVSHMTQHKHIGMDSRNSGTFPNQQLYNSGETSNDESNAYFRQPVNPQRHQTRQRRLRPSDYREL